MKKTYVIIMLIIVALPTTTMAKSLVILERDPFQRPRPVNRKQDRSGPKTKTVVKPLAELAVKLKLKATLVAGQDSMANVEGVLLKLGESIKGYRLLQVRKGEAVFEKNGEVIVISMDNNSSQKGKVISRLNN